jgi:hypothetical protein
LGALALKIGERMSVRPAALKQQPAAARARSARFNYYYNINKKQSMSVYNFSSHAGDANARAGRGNPRALPARR